uniref:Uncharacterized protein n=2 Tax=Latilactobacillus sakei TaxID=1599 RepID=A0A2D1C3C5_LATSK|nr:Hypothetical protein [Latilactobacillus sakei]
MVISRPSETRSMRTYTPQLKLLVFVLNFLYQKSPSATTKNPNKTNQNQFDLTYFRYWLGLSLNKLKSWLHLNDLISA